MLDRRSQLAEHLKGPLRCGQDTARDAIGGSGPGHRASSRIAG